MESAPREYIDAIDKLSSDDLRKIANYAYGLHKANKCQFIDKSITVWSRVMRD